MQQSDREHLDRSREAWRAFWDISGEQRVLTIDRNEAYCVCEVMYHTRFQELLGALKSLVSISVGWMPSSDLRIFILRLLGAKIGKNVYIAPWVLVDPMYPELIELENDVFLGMGCRLLTHEYTTKHFRIGRLSIGAGSVIGGWATIRSGVKIGRNVTVGLHSFVNKDFPDGSTVVGIPARVLENSRAQAPTAGSA